MSHLLLAHLSQDNNRPELAQALFEAHAGGATITVASRHNESEVYAIDGAYKGMPGPDWNREGKRRDIPEPPAAIQTQTLKKRKTLSAAKPTVIQTTLF